METIKAELFGQDAKANKVITFAQNVAVTKTPVLIVGEVGTGKKSLANYIHGLSSRNDQLILSVDCGQEAQTVENEILGHRCDETGRFNKGILERANGGTVILENVDGIAEDFQKRIYQIFQELADYEINVRIIATTTKNLSKLVGSGRFYRALYTYLSGTQITITSLRERSSDIQYISEFYLRSLCEARGVACATIEEEAMKKLLAHYWTHNVSELKTVIEASLENSNGEKIAMGDLALGDRKVVNTIADSSDEGIKLMSLKEAEKLLIKKALIHTSENRTQAAKILGVSIRTLRNKINEYRSDGSNFFLNLR